MSPQKVHQPLFVLRRHSSAVITCALGVEEVFPHLMLSGDVDGVVTLWDLELRDALLSFHVVETARKDAHHEGHETSLPRFANNGVLKVGFLAFAALCNTSADDDIRVCFYAQCRNQRLYLWQATLPNDVSYNCDEEHTLDGSNAVSLCLLHTIDVPQHGFCTVPCVSLSCREVQLALPHDGDGLLSLWNVEVLSQEGSSREDVRVHCFLSFSASGNVAKCGMIMCINYRDCDHIAVAFESGHVTLSNTRGEGLAIVRAFSETALTCLWAGNTLLASSAEGQLHSYSVVDLMTETEGESARDNSDPLSLVLRWELSLRKGLGSVALQRQLAVVGSWDHTLRLYDEGSGRVVTILTFHSGAVNEVSIAPPSSEWCTSFGYDVRRPRWSGAADSNAHKKNSSSGSTATANNKNNNNNNNNNNKKEDNDDANDAVYLFASASGDFTIAIWRVDFGVLRTLAPNAA